MCGRHFSRDIQESVSRATKLGVDPTVIEAVTGVSKRQIQRIVSEGEHGDLAQDCGRCTHQRILKSEHLEVSGDGVATGIHLLTGELFIISS